MKNIGGFFELELPYGKNEYHKNALALSTGRACINLIIKKLNPSKVWMPFYTCDATFEPFNIHQIPIEYYELDTLFFPKQLPELKQNEYLFYINYFGLKSTEIRLLIEKYGSQLIIDDTHSFFGKGYPTIWSFTSARKYFGVPDGAYLYSPVLIEDHYNRFTGISIEHNLNRLIGRQEFAYNQFIEYEKTLTSEIHSISLYSELILSHIDYEGVIANRKSNFRFYEAELGAFNQLSGVTMTDETPFCYPFLPSVTIQRNLFFPHQIYIPAYWLDTLNRNVEGFEYEKKISSNMLPLTIDHRYNVQDLERVVEMIKKYIHGK
jgi:hypothetical protein